MNDKSHVTLEQHRCLVCCKDFDTGNLLLDTRIVNGQLRKTFDKHTVTGTGLCPAHEKLHKDGFVALVACDESKSERLPNGNIKASGAYRTGLVCHVRRTVLKTIINVSLTDERGVEFPMLFCDEAVIHKLQSMTGANDEVPT